MARAQGLTISRGNRGLLVVAALAGLAAAVLFVVAVNQDGGTSGTTGGGATVKAVVATQSIAASTQIDEGMVEVIDVPEDLLVARAFAETQPVVGQVTTYAIAEGEQITPSRIGSPREGSTGGASDVVPPDMRGFSISVDQTTAVGGHLLPGDRVDIIAIFGPDHSLASSQAEGGAGMTILQNIEVLSVGDVSQEGRATSTLDANGDGTRDTPTSGQVPEGVEEQPGAGTLTLIVSPEQAQLLALVQEEAQQVYTSLRGFGDEAPVELPTVDISSVRPR
jgi:Flp pilus assembly protein CpaB